MEENLQQVKKDSELEDHLVNPQKKPFPETISENEELGLKDGIWIPLGKAVQLSRDEGLTPLVVMAQIRV